MTADLATREKAALLAQALDKASLALENAKDSASDEDYIRLEEAHEAAEIAYQEHGHSILTKEDGTPFKCPMCKCQLLESDTETEDEV